MMWSNVQAVLQRTDIVDLISQAYELDPDSERYWRSIEHDSLVVDGDKQVFHWNSRGLSGDALTWLRDVCGMSFKEAMDVLEGMTGVKYEPVVPSKPPKDLTVDAERYHQALITNRSRVRGLSKQRGLWVSTILKARLGYYNEGWGKRGWAIPHWDWLQGGSWPVCHGIRIRLFDGTKRYWAIPGSRFGMYTPVRLTGATVYITEGEFKALHIVQIGGVAVSTPLGAWHDEWTEILSKFGLVFAFMDNDDAGISFVEKVKENLPHAHILAPGHDYKGVDDWIIGEKITSLVELVTGGFDNV